VQVPSNWSIWNGKKHWYLLLRYTGGESNPFSLIAFSFGYTNDLSRKQAGGLCNNRNILAPRQGKEDTNCTDSCTDAHTDGKLNTIVIWWQKHVVIVAVPNPQVLFIPPVDLRLLVSANITLCRKLVVFEDFPNTSSYECDHTVPLKTFRM
jgi:hypothetical protein